MPSKIRKSDLIRAYQKVDLYRAKYPHPDLTPHGWCFHGNQDQGWAGYASNHRLYFYRGITSNTIDVDADTYRYLTIRINIETGRVKEEEEEDSCPCYTNAYLSSEDGYKTSVFLEPDGSIAQPYTYIYYNDSTTDLKVEVEFTDASSQTFTREVAAEFGENTLKLDISGMGTVNHMAITVQSKGKEDTYWNIHEATRCGIEYIKMDSKDIFREIYDDEKTITQDDINYLKDLVREIDINESWPNRDQRVKKFISTIKRNEFVGISEIIKLMEPYNGCDTCDSFTCECYSAKDGFQACVTCDGCNSYSPCYICDETCYNEATDCSCDETCYNEARDCECDQGQYDYDCWACYSTKFTGTPS